MMKHCSISRRAMLTRNSSLQAGLEGSPHLGYICDGPIGHVLVDDELPTPGLLPHEAQLLSNDLDLVLQQGPGVASIGLLQLPTAFVIELACERCGTTGRVWMEQDLMVAPVSFLQTLLIDPSQCSNPSKGGEASVCCVVPVRGVKP